MRKSLFSLVLCIVLSLAGWLAVTAWRDRAPASAQLTAAPQPSSPVTAPAAADPLPATPPPASTRAAGSAGAADLAVFGGRGAVQLEDVPPGRFQDELRRLAPADRARALQKLGDLRVPLNDVGSLRVDGQGRLYYECAAALPPAPTGEELTPEAAAVPGTAAAAVPIASPPIRHSKPGASKVIYLDFNGHTITGTAWNATVATYVAKPYNSDGNAATFSDVEQAAIVRIWERVAEDYRPFDVDVTTEEPVSFTPTTGRVLITESVGTNGAGAVVDLPSASASGVAYLGVFGEPDYSTVSSPAFVYADKLSNRDDYIAETAAHEMGHNLSLSHDGTASQEYYGGHGGSYYYSTEVSWGPIMGAPFDQQQTQWSKGEYYQANNLQDDLAILAGHLGYKPTDANDTNGTAESLTVVGTSLTGQGEIGGVGDGDRFAFTVGLSSVSFTVTPLRLGSYTNGGNLDVRLQLYDAAGQLVATDTSDTSSATLAAGLTAGTYYLRVSGTGYGTPTVSSPTGYTAYGSMGRYAVSGSVSAVVPPNAPGTPSSNTVTAGQSVSFYGNSYGTPTPTLQWQRLPAGSSVWADIPGGGAYAGVTSSNLTIAVTTLDMNGDQFRVVATNIGGSVTSGPAVLTVYPAQAPAVFGLPSALVPKYGETLSLYPQITGTTPMTYVWKKDGVAVPDATGSSFYKSGLTTADNGLYTLTATNSAGSTTSAAVLVTVSPAVAPGIYNLPAQIAVSSGDTLSISPTITGTQPMTYVWKKDGATVPLATGSSFYKGGVSATDAGVYTVTATNLAGSATSGQVTVTVLAPRAPAITNLPPARTVSYGDSISLSPYVYGTSPITYQWRKNGVAIPGATSSYFSRSSLTSADAGEYTLVATNAAGTTTSMAVILAVNPPVAPVIHTQSPAVAVPHGGSLSLAPGIVGTNPMYYQWKKDGVIIANATNASYSKSGVGAIDAGSYTLTVSNVAGAATSGAMLVTVGTAQPPAVLNLPPTLVVAAGEGINLNPTLVGSTPMTFVWAKDGVPLTGGYSANYSVYSVSPAHSGTYTLTVSNAAGSCTSDPVVVTVLPPIAPAIANLPTAVTVAAGSNFSLSPAITGSSPMAFQWSKDGVDIPGATNGYFGLSGVTAIDAGSYRLTAANEAGSATSSEVVVTVGAAVAPAILNLPAVAVVDYGETLSLSPHVLGTTPVTYQWKKDGVNLTSGTSSSYSKSGVTSADGGSYTLTATNAAGTTTSGAVAVTVNAAVAPAIYGLPPSRNVLSGNEIYFSTTVTGTRPMTYQWKKDGVDIPDATYSSMSKYGVTTADSGVYTLTATNLVGSTTSEAIVVTVYPATPPVISGLPATLTPEYNSYVNLNPSVTGTQPMTYQWKRNGVAIPGSTSSYFSMGNVTPAKDGTYTLTATNAVGTTTSSGVVITVSPAIAPVISGMGVAVAKDSGASWSLSPTITGTSPMTYQWKKDGVAIPYATSNYYSKSNLVAADGGAYTLTVSNSAGTTTSVATVLTVAPAEAPTIVKSPRSITVLPGSTAQLSVQAEGSVLKYQWYFGELPILGGTQTSLMLTQIDPTMTGDYHVVVSNDGGDVASAVATITVATPVGVARVAAGENYSFFIQTDGALWGMGANTYGQLGDGTQINRTQPVKVMTGVVAVAAGSSHSLFLMADGTLWAAGSNSFGQLGDGSTLTRTVPVQIASGVSAAFAGSYHSLYLKADGTLWAAGQNYNGQLGDGSTTQRNTPVPVATKVVAVSAGWDHTLFIRADGTLWGMGSNTYGQLGDGTTVSRSTPVQIAAGVTAATAAVGSYSSYFIKTDGTVWAMGNNSNGQLGDGTTTGRTTPVQVATGGRAVVAGSGHTLLLKADQTLWSVGGGYSGQLGNGSSAVLSTFGQIATSVQTLAAGVQTTLFVQADGSLWGAGSNSYGQLGLGPNIYSQYTPVKVCGGTPLLPAAPAAVAATDATLAQMVRVNWSPVPGATNYEVWRSPTTDSAAAVRLAAHVAHPLYFDQTAVVGTTYQYWVKAVNPAGASAFSGPDSGQAAASFKGATFSNVGFPATLIAGSGVSFPVTVTNIGSDAWTAGSRVVLRDALGNLLAEAAAANTAPDALRTVNLSFTAPAEGGVITLSLQVEETGVGPFGPVQTLTGKVVYAGTNGVAGKLFERVLGRSASLAEVTPFGTRLAGGGTRASVWDDLLALPEYQARQKERTIRLYYATFSRMPDQAGLAYWSAVLASGAMTPTQVATAFAQSAEFLGTYGDVGNAAFVTQMYRNTLGRDPDQAGLDYWVGQMNAGLTRGQMLLAFADSTEFQDRMAVEVEMVRFYHLVFGRMPSPAEMASWGGFLRGEDQTNVLLQSSEFTTAHPGAASHATFVQLAYQGLLLRNADQAVVDDLAAQLGAGTLTRPQLVSRILAGTEFQAAVVPVARHYLAVFLRPPDAVGATHWANQMRAGLSLSALAQVFAGSAEFAASYAGLSDADFVGQMYVNILGRAADPAGLNYWVNLFATGQSDETGLLLSFVQSAEAAQRFAPVIRTTAQFQTFYGRNPNTYELAFWRNYLDTLTEEFRDELLNGTEYNNTP